ncbi:MAG: hypothetical protein PGN13_16215 [Patulibacter minatonensis]
MLTTHQVDALDPADLNTLDYGEPDEPSTAGDIAPVPYELTTWPVARQED